MNKIANRQVICDTLMGLAKDDKNIYVLTSDSRGSASMTNFANEFPKQFVEVGIAEQNLVGAACGFAAAGKIPFASTFAMFATGRAFEIIRNSACYPKLNVKICATHAGITVGEDGGSHQSVEDISLMRSVPNMVVINPADDIETEAAIKAVAEMEGPCYVRLGRMAVSRVNDETNYNFVIGKGITLAEGNDVAIIATGIMVEAALEAKEELAKEGINARVINIHTIKPIDEELIIKAAKETGVIVTAEEHSVIGGLGSAVAEVVSENCPVPVLRVGVKDTFGESGKPNELLEKYGLTSNDIVNKVKKALELKK